MVTRTTKIARIIVGAAVAALVPAVVVAQFTTPANQQLTGARLNQTAANTCEIVVRTTTQCGAQSCTATCRNGFVVMGGGCRTNGAGTALRGATPGFSQGSFPDPDSFDALLQGGGTVTNFPGSGAPTGANPRWDSFGCEAVTGGTIQTAYALCCPLVSPP